MRDLAVLIPTRGRPENLRKVIGAWDFTNSWDHADMIVIADADDPEIQGYRDVIELTRHPDTEEALVQLIEMDEWMPMVHKLDLVASLQAQLRRYFALGFAGDDHLPQTIGWAERYLTVLRELGTGMVYGDDGYQGRKLSTEWAVTSDVVAALGRMVPAPVEHMYCDNSMMDLFGPRDRGGAGALLHLPEIRIEHMHPYAGKAETDAQYQRVNHRDQFKTDRRAYERWLDQGRADHVALVRDLRKGRPDMTNEPTPARPRVAGSAPRKVVQRSGPSAARQPRDLRVPRHFRNVRAATPEDVMTALADFAAQVPADQEIVELGVFQGRTALQMAWGASQGHGAHVTGVDAWDLPGNTYGPPFTDPESKAWARHHVTSLGYSGRITLIQEFASDAAAVYPGPPVGLLFVDDDHSYAGARRALESWAPHLAPGARIAVDDYGHPDWPGVKEAVDALVAEGFLEPLEIFHDHLAATRLTARQEWATTGHAATPIGNVTAITSEGVSPSPVAPDTAALEAEWERVDPEGVAALRESAAALADDNAVSRDDTHRGRVSLEEAITVEGTSVGQAIGELSIPTLKALAKHRGIVLGVRKDKRDLILAALRDGR